MKRLLLCIFFAATAAVARPVFAEPPGQLDEIGAVLQLTEAGMSDEVIIKHIRARGYRFDLSTDDLIALRRSGVSDAVLEAMLDTALLDTRTAAAESTLADTVSTVVTGRAEPPPAETSDTHVAVQLSAGWFSPWYYYPYAWGFYYDPFPACYSYYYYPFRFAYGWGYYGYCNNYYYSNCWRPYRYWDSPHWYDVAAAHPAMRVRTPHSPEPTGRPAREVTTGRPRAGAESPYAMPHASAHRTRLAVPAVRHAADRNPLHVRPPAASGSQAAAPWASRREAAPAPSPRGWPSRGGAPTSQPRQQVAPFGSSRPASPAFAPRGGFGTSAPRGGGVSMPSRPASGARVRAPH